MTRNVSAGITVILNSIFRNILYNKIQVAIIIIITELGAVSMNVEKRVGEERKTRRKTEHIYTKQFESD